MCRQGLRGAAGVVGGFILAVVVGKQSDGHVGVNDVYLQLLVFCPLVAAYFAHSMR